MLWAAPSRCIRQCGSTSGTVTNVTAASADQGQSSRSSGWRAASSRNDYSRSGGRLAIRSLLRTLNKAVRNPERAALRLFLKARLARQDPSHERARLLKALGERWGVDGTALAAEYRQSEFAQWFGRRRQELRRYAASTRMGSSGGFTCEALYLLVRAARPRTVVETGVLYGASSAHILAALAMNGQGELHSVDLGCQPEEPPHDFFVPRALTPRWHYHVGDSREILPALLERLGSIDLFHHDSLHTFEHMIWEYETARKCLSPRGVVSSHDVMIAHSLGTLFAPNAFHAFCSREGLQATTFANSGFAVRPGFPAEVDTYASIEPSRRTLAPSASDRG